MNKFDPAAYISSLNIDVMRFGLDAEIGLLSRLGDPQHSYKTILIAGTNGKGSTAAMISSILHTAGYRTGLYTSPHLIDVRERIAVNGKKIAQSDFREVLAAVKKEVAEPVTYFEVLTAAALLYFQRRKVDIAVLEAGLGGRLDATNVCRPLVAVITNIDFDHTAYLGKTLTAIAGEKAGIIKKGGVCVTAATQSRVLNVLEDACRRKQARFYKLGSAMKIRRQKDGRIAYCGLYRDLNNLKLALTGGHQLANAALALATIEIIGKKGFPTTAAAVEKGLAATRWAARLEILCRRPLFVVDGAHNPAGIKVLCRALKNDFSYRRLVLIFSALADKDYHRMLRKIAPLAQQIILVQLRSQRAVPVTIMQEYLNKNGYRAVIAENAAAAVKLAFDLAVDCDMICGAGSLYLAGELKQAFPPPVSCGKNPDV